MRKKSTTDEFDLISEDVVIHKGAKFISILFALIAWLLFLAGLAAIVIPWIEFVYPLSINEGVLAGLILISCALFVGAVSCVISLLVTIARNSEDSIALLESSLGSYNLE